MEYKYEMCGPQTWHTVVTALGGGFANVGSYIADEVDAALLAAGICPAEKVIYLATHSWGGRERTLIEGRKPFEVAEPLFSGAWEILREGDVSQVAVESATSGSRTEAVLFPEGWHITLSVPCDQDGSGPYMGCYWDAFWGAAKTAEAQVECKCEHVQAVPSEA